MKTQNRVVRLIVSATLIAFSTSPAVALSLEQYERFSEDHRAQFVSAAVSMAAYIAAAEGDVAKRRCILDWYFGANGKVGEGVDQMATEILVASKVDAKKFHIEGVILGLTEKACGGRKTLPSQSATR